MRRQTLYILFVGSIFFSLQTTDAYPDGKGGNGTGKPPLGYDLHSTKIQQSQGLAGKKNNVLPAYVDAVIFGNDTVLAGSRQLIQINVANTLKIPKRYDMRIRLIKPNGQSDYLPFKRIRITPRSVERILFRYVTDPRLEGIYKIEASLFTRGNPEPIQQVVIPVVFFTYLKNSTSPPKSGNQNELPDDIYALFDTLPDNGDGGASGGIAGEIAGFDQNGNPIIAPDNGAQNNIDQNVRESQNTVPGRQGVGGQTPASSGVPVEGASNNAPKTQNTSGRQGSGNADNLSLANSTFGQTTDATSLIDLKWQKLRLASHNILRGENSTASIYLTNNGKAIAENVPYAIYMVRKIFKDNYSQTKPLLEGNYPFIAPGETKRIVIPINIESDLISGEYVLVAQIDPKNRIVEMNKENNYIGSETIYLSEILLIDPAEGTTINSNSEITFTWRSNQYVLFYIQISHDKEFRESDILMRLPVTQPTPLSSITALRGEVENLIKHALDTNDKTFYWRVVGFDPQNNRVASPVKKFYFNPL